MTIIILFNPYSACLPAIVKVGSSAPSSASSGLHKRHNNNKNYDIFLSFAAAAIQAKHTLENIMTTYELFATKPERNCYPQYRKKKLKKNWKEKRT